MIAEITILEKTISEKMFAKKIFTEEIIVENIILDENNDFDLNRGEGIIDKGNFKLKVV